MSSCVELKKEFGINPTFAAKNNNNFFPIAVLCQILKSRYDRHSISHWVTMKTDIDDASVIAIVHS